MSDIAKAFEQLNQPAPLNSLLNMPIPQIVINSYGHNHSTSEITSIVAFGPRPSVMLIMAPVVAKSFALSLLETVSRYEEATGTIVPLMEELAQKIAAYNEKQES